MTKAQWLDLLERSAWTFVQTFLGVILAAGLLDSASFDLEAWKAAAIAAVIAGVKAIVAQQFGNGTAATLPAKDEPTPPVVEGGDDYPLPED
jgi:hypothetical protein